MHPRTRLLAFRAALPKSGQRYAQSFLHAADAFGLSPFLLAAICDRESRYGAALAPDLTGDCGHGRGLMQIDDRAHPEWIALGAWRDPAQNVLKGAHVLADARAFFCRAPRQHVVLGTFAAQRRGVSPGRYPDPRPLADEALVRAAVAAYNTGAQNVLMSLACGADPDCTTTGKDYSADVLRRAAALEAAFTAAMAA
jgi:hypothetical protein